MFKNLIRALRLPFITASVLPFLFGSFISRAQFNLAGFLLGFLAVVATHLSANLMNDYADSKSGADWQDKRPYVFFGGSKLIQEGAFSEQFYLRFSLACAAVAAAAVAGLALVLGTITPVFYYGLILFLAWAYSARPLQLSYRRMGEAALFVLFGPALVMGGYYIQTGIFPALKSFIVSFPFGFLVTAVLLANEVPDGIDDRKAGKMTLVTLVGPARAFILYTGVVAAAFVSIVAGTIAGYLRPVSLFSLLGIIPAYRAAQILKDHYADKARLIESSRLTILAQVMASIILIAGVW